MTGVDPHSEHVGTPDAQHGGHGGHRWMMIACCIPMLVIAAALVLTGVANGGTIIFALACTAMMALMMAEMGHGARSSRGTQYEPHARREPGRRVQRPAFSGLLQIQVGRLHTKGGAFR